MCKFQSIYNIDFSTNISDKNSVPSYLTKVNDVNNNA